MVGKAVSDPDVSVVDLLDPATYADGIPHGVFESLRRERIARCHSPLKGVNFWAIGRHEDLSSVNRDTETFSSERNGVLLGGDKGALGPNPSMPNVDPPHHTRLRRYVSRAFSRGTIGRLEPLIREKAREILDRIAPLGECDFVNDIAAALPREVIGHMLAIPPEDREQVIQWSLLFLSGEDPEYIPQIQQERPWESLNAYAHKLAAERRVNPGDDLVSSLLELRDEMTVAEFETMFVILTVAGNETTRDSIAGGMKAFMEYPEQREMLLERPELFPSAVEEILRWATPGMYFARTATRDTEVAGQAILEGEQIAMFYAAANFDPEVFADPYRFDITRRPNPHVTFGGGGPHLCLGAHLARLETQIMFEELLPRLQHMEPAGPMERIRSHFHNGPKRMPIRFSMT